MSRRPASSRELDLVPIMNLVTILIPFLLLSASFVSLASIDSTLPAVVPEQTPPPEPTEDLHLSVAVTLDGYAVTADQPIDLGTARLARTSERLEPASWPAEELRDALATVKRQYPAEDTVILNPDASVTYDVLIHTMDAARGRARELFPAVVIAGGAP